MANRVLTCIDYDEPAGECITEAWVEQPSFVELLPTAQQAHSVGAAMLVACVAVAAMSLFLPSRASTED